MHECGSFLTQNQVVIRPATESDALVYRDLRLEALRDHPAAFSADFARNLAEPLEYWVERLRNVADNHSGMLYFAQHDAGLIGMTGIFRAMSPKNQHSGLIWGVYVRPAWRGRRVAERLIESCLGWASDQGLRIVKLAVVTTNTSAIRCYERCGFARYGVEPKALHVNGVDYDELLMARTI